MLKYTRTLELEAPVEALWRYHARPGALERLVPPWQDVRVVRSDRSLEPGSEVLLRLGAGPFGIHWLARHTALDAGERFVDEQVYGPFSEWKHQHEFTNGGATASVKDEVQFRLPFSPVSDAIAGGLARKQLDRMFEFRHTRTRNDVMRHQKFADVEPLTIAITGSSGLVGTDLEAFLSTAGHRVVPVVRSEASDDEIRWSPSDGEIDAEAFRGVDVVIHLAGESLVGRWTDEKKRRIMQSRATGTRLLAEALAKLDDGPHTLLSASATGYYGDRGDERLDEESPPGDGFLADVCKAWEEATQPAVDAGLRVVNMRFGVMLSSAGGALKQMLPAFKMGVGGKIGGGEQYFPWIALEDVVGAVQHIMHTEDLTGPVNVVAPNPVTNAEFTDALGDVLSRPTILPLPEFAVKTVFGQMGEETLLQGQRVKPSKLEASGFDFLYPDVRDALRHELGK